MGQTLPNGIYLPAEGERNCYDGLEGNWRSLDSLISTVAGKASATHTHGNISNDGKVGTAANKPLITGTGGAVQAGSFGNAANTFCEGNDSRLSDARTPVAHTHTKSDVTDLLNSNFIPSANNSYDLGSSSYQWNNLYAKNYFYNGVAWGLDKENVWTGNNSYTGTLSLESSSDVAEQFKQKLPKDVSTSNDAMARVNSLVDSAGHYVVVETIGHWSNYVGKNITLKYKNDSTKQGAVELRLYSDGSGIFYPQSPFGCDLGNIYNKWKTLNGVDPGALSLPKTDSSITGIETSGFSFDGTSERIPDTVNIFSNGVALMNGWLCARIAEGAGHYIFLSSDDNTGRYGICSSCFSSGIVTTLSFGVNAYVPIKAGDKPAIRWAKPNGGGAQLVFYPCLGNV